MSPHKITPLPNEKAVPIEIGVKGDKGFFKRFLLLFTAFAMLSFFVLHIHWIQLISRFINLGSMFWDMAHFSLHEVDFTLISFVDTFSIMILATLYSLIAGLLFALMAAENVMPIRFIARFTKVWFTFLRAVPTPVWVLLTLVCFGFGPVAGICGLSVHTTAFFTRTFSQAFEDVPQDTLDALKSLGATRGQIITNALIPTALTELISWTALRFEINFSECAILGMVGAGGIGYAIEVSMENHQYGVAGLAIFIVFAFAFLLERICLFVKQAVR